MSSKRRKEFLPISEPKFKVYHEHFDNLRISSPILTPGERIDIHTTMMDKVGMEGLLIERIGDDNKEYLKNGKPYIALIPGIEASLKDIERRYALFSQDLKDQGRRPIAMENTSFWEQKLRSLAGLDVINEEVEILQERLKAITDQVQAENDNNMLRYGPKGDSHNHGSRSATPNLIKEMDGQKVEYVGDVLCIVDKRSPYNGMSVIDYRDLCMAYKAIQREKGLSTLHQIDKKDLPPWPKNMKNYLKKEVEKI